MVDLTLRFVTAGKRIVHLVKTRKVHMKRIIIYVAALYLAACATPHDKPGPWARGVPANAPPDTIGVFLSWTPDQTLVNFRRIDRIFTTHTIHHGANVRPLPRAGRPLDFDVGREECHVDPDRRGREGRADSLDRRSCRAVHPGT